MKKVLTVLVVEDDTTAYQVIVDAVKNSNREEQIEKGEEGVRIQLRQAKTFAEAEQELATSGQSFDAAIIDLKLADDTEPSDSEDAGKLGGRLVVDLIFKVFQLPMFVYTGTPSHIESLRDRVSPFFKIHKRDEVLVADIISEILAIHRGGLLNLLGDDGVVQTFGKHFHEIFWRHLASDGEYWLIENNRDALKRYVAQHMMEYLERSPEPAHAGFIPMHPAETYIAPSIKERVYTGDILRDRESGKLWVVLTPACDIVFQKKVKDTSVAGGIRYIRKAEFITLAYLTPWEAMPGLKDDKGNIVEGHVNKLKEYKSSSQRYCFLPKHKRLGASFIDFQKLLSVPEPDIDTEKYERVAAISGPFIKDIIAQFSYYYSRQGAPSLSGGMADWI